MWICLKDAFFSVVEHYDDNELVVVRSRFPDDIHRVFGYDADHTPQNDYPYRVTMGKAEFADTLTREALAINYGNFKSEADHLAKSDADKRRCRAYHRMWGVMNDQGDPGKYSPRENFAYSLDQEAFI